MAPKSKKSIFDVEESPFDRENPPEIKNMRLRDIFAMKSIGLLKMLTHYGMLREFGGECPDCPAHPTMTLVSAKDRSDGLKWRCPKCLKRERSLRYDSVFVDSKLTISTQFALLYMWVQDFENHHAERELDLDDKTVTLWFARFRQVCVEYGYRLGKIGGEGKIVEMDQTCLVHQKHHRGKPKPGTQVWYCVAVERDSGGRCCVSRVDKRDIETIDWFLDCFIADGTTLITDEWRAHINITQRLVEKGYRHFVIRHKKATGGGFARWVNLKDDLEMAARLGVERNSKGNYWLRVHTNKCEGLNAHLKHKLKRIRGTSRRYVEGYLAEAVFRQNSLALLMTPFEAFLDLISEPVEFNETEEDEDEDGVWNIVRSDESDGEGDGEEGDGDSEDDGNVGSN